MRRTGPRLFWGEAGIDPRLVNKVHEGRPHIQDRIKNGEYTYTINTTEGRQAIEDSKLIRRSALQYKVHYDTTLRRFRHSDGVECRCHREGNLGAGNARADQKVINKRSGEYCSNRICNIILKGFL